MKIDIIGAFALGFAGYLLSKDYVTTVQMIASCALLPAGVYMMIEGNK